MAGAGVLAAGGAVVVGSVAGSVVVVVATLKERVVRSTVGETAADTHAATASTKIDNIYINNRTHCRAILRAYDEVNR